MCDYCVQHGHGKRWYMSARNYSKELARSETVRKFNEAFFGRTDVQPGTTPLVPTGRPTQEEREKADLRYRQFLHHQVINTEEAISIIQLASEQTEESDRTVVLLPCICRYRAYGKDPALSCYGLAFTHEYTRQFPKYGGGGHEYVSPQEAQDHLLQLIQKTPIVHALSALGVPYLGMLCNCDMPVCRPYLIRQRLNITSPFYKAHHRASIDFQKCTGCGICQEVCPFNVAKVSSHLTQAQIDTTACYGCGVCQRNCPESAITLEPIEALTQF
jgi:Pyruvate/2-oxoacid:ferredoxin oxidoreductase delta subunit